MRSILTPIIESAIAQKVTPGLVVLVRQCGRLVCHEAFGCTASLEDAGAVVMPDTIYDAASITKSAVTSVLLMTLVAEGRLGLDTVVSPLLPELVGPGTEDIRLRDLLGHVSGLPAHRHFFDSIWAGDLAGATNPKDALVVMAGQTPLEYGTGSQTIYSDLGYILLGRLIERVADSALETVFAERIGGPLGMVDSGFGGQVAGKLSRIAPSQRYADHRGLLHGRVHDDNANSGGGVCGHAGLFTTAPDLSKLAAALLHSYHCRQSDTFLPQEIIHSFWHTKAAPDTSWRMGWDTFRNLVSNEFNTQIPKRLASQTLDSTPPSEAIRCFSDKKHQTPSLPGVSHAGDHWPKSLVGHLGFTGTAWWLAPEEQISVVILTNRVYYSWEKTGIKRLRRALMDAIAGELLPCPRVS